MSDPDTDARGESPPDPPGDLSSGRLTGGPSPAAARCPECGAADVGVVEDVSDEVTVYGCGACGATWAQRSDDGR